MELLSIVIVENKKNVFNIIDNFDFKNNVKIEPEYKGNRIFIKIKAQDESLTKKDIEFYNTLSHLVTKIIMEHYLKETIYKRTFAKYDDLTKSEKAGISKIAYGAINGEIFKKNGKNIVFKEVYDYIIENDEIAIDGFVNFRLNSIENPLDELIEFSKEKFFEELEYKEFIKILRYFVDIQEPKLDLVNIVIDKSDYKLYDKNNNLIENDIFCDIIKDLSNDGISKEDLLISSIITIAPKCIVIHGHGNEKENEIISILENVFPGAVLYCTGCELCLFQLPIDKEK